ncbi:MAG: double zinc ribbon domain-containing protein [Actinomycetota bacterium]|nr:double zinc ribbon domain-containing protein [Actinomycetota bacterium]
MNLSHLNLGQALKDMFLAPACCLCGRITTGSLCDECRQQIEVIGTGICDRCGKPDSEAGCSFCSRQSLYYWRCRSFAFYRTGIKTIIYRYKQLRLYQLSGLLASWLQAGYLQHYKGENIELLDGVPGSHIHRICKHLESRLKIPYANNLMKIKENQEQKHLDSYSRKYNPAGSYKVVDCLKYWGRELLLIDDVFTTGSTLNQIAWLAKQAGAEKVYLLTVARGEQHI